MLKSVQQCAEIYGFWVVGHTCTVSVIVVDFASRGGGGLAAFFQRGGVSINSGGLIFHLKKVLKIMYRAYEKYPKTKLCQWVEETNKIHSYDFRIISRSIQQKLNLY